MHIVKGLRQKGLPLILLIVVEVALVTSSREGLPFSENESSRWSKEDRIARHACVMRFGEESNTETEKCRIKLRRLLLAGDDPSSETANVMTASMMRVLPCAREMCSNEINQSDLFECIRSKCIYKSAIRIQDEAADEPISGLNDLLAGNSQETGLGDVLSSSYSSILSKNSESLCLNRCLKAKAPGSVDLLCYPRCLLSLSQPQELKRRAPSKPSLVAVGKRWSSRLCMEAHCKRFEVNGGDWFRCGQNNCGR